MPPIAFCLVSVRRVSGQRYSAFKSGDLCVHRPARRTQVRLRGLALRKSPRLKGMRSAAAPKLAAHGTFWPWGVYTAVHRIPSGKTASTPASRIGESGADASSRDTAPSPASRFSAPAANRVRVLPLRSLFASATPPRPEKRWRFCSLRFAATLEHRLGAGQLLADLDIVAAQHHRLCGMTSRRRSGVGGVSETNPDKHGSLAYFSTRDRCRGECLVTVYCRNALPCAIPDCRDRTPAPQRRRTTFPPLRYPRLCHIV